MQIEVVCYSGYRGEETPRQIRLGDRKIEVKEIQDRWLAPNHRYFKVLGDDNAIYILRHDSESWDWDLTFYKDRQEKQEYPFRGSGFRSYRAQSFKLFIRTLNLQ